ncbi:MAG: Ppx/GppA phosphatase family protein [Pseudomonadota bacterium]
MASSSTDLSKDPAGQSRRARRRGRVYAAIDLGTNNCRLLVARPAKRGFQVVDAFSRIVRLGEGLTRRGALSEEAMERALGALNICAGKIERRGARHVRAVATEACRQAANCDDFLARVRDRTGIALEIISSSVEAHLALHGCAPLLDLRRPNALVFDIGGGSTQVSWLEVSPATSNGRWSNRPSANLRAWHSVPIGVVTLAERYGGHSISRAVYEAMIEDVVEPLARFETEQQLGGLVAEGQMQMVGTSGTVTTLAGVHKKLPRYNRARVDGTHLDFGTVRRLSGEIAAMSYDQRLVHPCIGRERADLVVAGCAILEAICRTWPVGRLRVADRGLREGILFNLMQANSEARAAPRNG